MYGLFNFNEDDKSFHKSYLHTHRFYMNYFLHATKYIMHNDL